MTQTADNLVQQSIGKRLLMVLLYLLGCIGGSILLAILLSSAACFNEGRCNHVDQIIYAIVAVLDFIMAFVLLIFGINGKLPGARYTKSV